jgi:hypothetical protein
MEIEVRTAQMSYHPLTRGFRDVFERRRDTVLAVADALPGTVVTEYEVE